MIRLKMKKMGKMKKKMKKTKKTKKMKKTKKATNSRINIIPFFLRAFLWMCVVSYHVGVRIEHVRWMRVDKEFVTKKRIHERGSE